MSNPYRKTLTACYLGFITQAITANFAPLLFMTFYRSYGIAFGVLALIPTCFFFTQLIVDLLCALFLKKRGYRAAVIASSAASAAGLAGLAFLPELLPSPFVGILLCVLVYAVGSGLIEVLGSPIVEAIPAGNKAARMSLLHSFYCWGSVGVIAVSTLFLALFGAEHWRPLALLWALIPLCNIVNFALCPIPAAEDESDGLRPAALLTNKTFWLLTALMLCAGASELSMAQWAYAFAESALHISKTAGDLVGPCGFAVCMGLSRVIFAKQGDKPDLTVYMTVSAVLCVGCYLLAALSGLPVFGLIGCTLCGFTVGIMWPGSITLSAAALPAGGTALFAFLALAGDLGGTVGPALVGTLSQSAGNDLRFGLLFGLIFPLGLLACVLTLRRKRQQNR